MKFYPVKILSGNRITIPKEIFNDLNMEIGQFVLTEFKNNRFYITPAKLVPSNGDNQ